MVLSIIRSTYLFLHVIVAALLISTMPALAENPQANSDAMVIFGNARFTVLTTQLIRMEYSAEKQFEDHASFTFINRQTPPSKFSYTINGNKLSLHTDKIQLTYVNDGNSFDEKNLHVEFSNGAKKNIWAPHQLDTANLKGTMRTLDGVDGWNHEADLEQGILSRSGWSLIDDSENFLFDGATDWNWVTTRTHNNIDWYLFAYGDNYKKALYDFTSVAGKIPMPPKYAFGYWWSRYWIYNDSEMRELVDQIHTFDIPLDVLIIDMDWHETYGFQSNNIEWDSEGQAKGWTGYTWNKKLFPQPEKFIQWSNEQHLKTALNLHLASGIPPMEEKYKAFANAYGVAANNENIPYNMSDKKWATIYFDLLLKPMEQWGIDFWWLDWQQYLTDKKIPNLSTTWWQNYTFFTHMEQTDNRPMIVHRWGGMGNHRYPLGFSGDANTNWETLDFETYFTSTAANVGYGYISNDIGGHASDKPTDGELYLRWIQFGTLSPILRTHGSKISLIERRPWMFPRYFFAMRDAIKLRYRLAPYLYAAAHDTYETGVSFMHPLYYEYPHQAEAYTFKTQYMFGDKMIAAPITTPVDVKNQLATKTFWLPKGDWFELETGTLLEGNKTITRHYSLNEIPLFVKAGSIIPMNPDVKNLQEKPATQILTIIPGENPSSVELYEDDEKTNHYKSGQFSKRKVTKMWTNNKSLQIIIDPVAGGFVGMPEQQTFDIKLLNSVLPEKIYVNGLQLSAQFLHTELASLIHLPSTSVHEKMIIDIKFEKTFREQMVAFNGNKGFLQRVTQATDTLKYAVALNDWGGTLPNAVYEAGNVINELIYEPERAYPLLQQLNNDKKTMADTISRINTIMPETSRSVIEFLGLQPTVTH